MFLLELTDICCSDCYFPTPEDSIFGLQADLLALFEETPRNPEKINCCIMAQAKEQIDVYCLTSEFDDKVDTSNCDVTCGTRVSDNIDCGSFGSESVSVSQSRFSDSSVFMS